MAESLIDNNGNLNRAAYNQQVDKQREVFDKIDSTMAVLEQLPMLANTLRYGGILPIAINPLGFIFNIIEALGVEEETLIDWIVEILTWVLPAVEIGIKAALLANIKALISCNTDPRIPFFLRKRINHDIYTNILKGRAGERGIDINIDAIDPEGMLDLSPFTEPGCYKYFGIEDEEDTTISVNGEEVKSYNNFNSRVAKLVRADDMNAFLWYVIHKGNKQAPVAIKIVDGEFCYPYNATSNNCEGKKYTISEKTTTKAAKRTATVQKETLMGVSVIKPKDGYSEFVEGTTFTCVDAPNTLAICVEAERDEMGNIVSNTLVNVSSDWYSCNWYVDITNYYGSNLGVKERTERDYTKEKGIFNLRYCQTYDYQGNRVPTAPNNLRFTVLPKPYVLLPSLYKTITGTEAALQWRPIRLLFDAEGNPDQKGKFSFDAETPGGPFDLINKELGNDGILMMPITGTSLFLKVNTKTGKYEIEGDDMSELNKVLVECYPGLTVYEFNYDYVMGMRLFDPKVICYNLFENAADPKYAAFFGFTLNKTKDKNLYPFLAGKQRVIEIVREILEQDDEEIDDCFFNFSNKQYDEMLKKTEELRYRQLPYNQGYNKGQTVDFSEVTDILKDYPENGTLEEQKTVIKKALERACAIVDERDGSNITALSDKGTTKIDFLTNILQQLVAEIVDAVLSPKVLMLIMINKILMGDEGEALSVDELLRMVKNLITSMIKEIRDLIVKKLLDYILQYLTPLALQIKAKIQSEQFAAYMAIIRLLLSWYNKGLITAMRLSAILSALFSKRKDYDFDNTDIDLPSVLDDVNYADIFASDIKDKEPIINKC